MGCVLVLIGLFFPRLLIIVLALTSDYLSRAFHGVLLPVLGFFFAPFTTLAYALAMNAHGSISGWFAVVFVVAILADLGVVGGGRSRLLKRRKERE